MDSESLIGALADAGDLVEGYRALQRHGSLQCAHFGTAWRVIGGHPDPERAVAQFRGRIKSDAFGVIAHCEVARLDLDTLRTVVEDCVIAVVIDRFKRRTSCSLLHSDGRVEHLPPALSVGERYAGLADVFYPTHN